MPQHRYTSTLTLGGLVVVAVVVSLAADHVAGLDRNITTLIQTYEREDTMQTLTESVETSTGRTIVVTTTRGEEEDVTAFVKRHDVAVQAAKLL